MYSYWRELVAAPKANILNTQQLTYLTAAINQDHSLAWDQADYGNTARARAVASFLWFKKQIEATGTTGFHEGDHHTLKNPKRKSKAK
jgi:hypothetical protein